MSLLKRFTSKSNEKSMFLLMNFIRKEIKFMDFTMLVHSLKISNYKHVSVHCKKTGEAVISISNLLLDNGFYFTDTNKHPNEHTAKHFSNDEMVEVKRLISKRLNTYTVIS